MIIKKDKKLSVTVKEAFVEEGHLIDAETGESLDMADVIGRIFGANEVKIQVTSSTSEEIDLPSDSEE